MSKPPPQKPVPEEEPKPRVKVSHEGGRAVLQWAADTARMLALSASQVMRKLDTNSLKLEDEEPPGGAPAARRGAPMPGGGMNPYDHRVAARAPARTRGRDTHRASTPTPARPAAGVSPSSRSSPASAKPAPTSWWRRLLGRG